MLMSIEGCSNKAIFKTNSETRRLLQQGGVKVTDIVIEAVNYYLNLKIKPYYKLVKNIL